MKNNRIHDILIEEKDINELLPETHNIPLASDEILIEISCKCCEWNPHPNIEKSKMVDDDLYNAFFPYMLKMQKHSDKNKHQTIMKCYTPSQSIFQTSVIPRPKIAQFLRHADGEPTLKSKYLYWTLALSAIPIFSYAMLDGITIGDLIPTVYATFWAWTSYNRIANQSEQILN